MRARKGEVDKKKANTTLTKKQKVIAMGENKC